MTEEPQGQLDDVLEKLQAFEGLDSDQISQLLAENAEALPQDLNPIRQEATEKLAEFDDVLDIVNGFLTAVQQVRDAKGEAPRAADTGAEESEEAKIERLSRPIIAACEKVREKFKRITILPRTLFDEIRSVLGEEYEFITDYLFHYAVIQKDGYSFLLPNPRSIGIQDLTYSNYDIIDLGDHSWLQDDHELLKLAYCETKDYKGENSEFVKGLIDNKNPEAELKRVVLEFIRELEGNEIPDDFDARKEFEEAMESVTSEKMWTVLRNFQVDHSEEDVGKILISLMNNIIELSEKKLELERLLELSKMAFKHRVHTCDRDDFGGLVDHLRKINDESPECSKAILALLKVYLRIKSDYESEAAPKSEESAETAEEPKKLVFQQLKYGKKVQYSGGPIVKGYDHDPTGASKDFPFKREEWRAVFPGVQGYSSNYPWEDEGGQILVKEMEQDGQKYIVCQRYKMRSEGGDSGRGRNYHEQHYIAIPAEEWSIAAIPKLAEVLSTTPILQDDDKNWEMSPIEIEVPFADTKLPEGWFDEYVQDLVAHIVSGKPIQLADPDMSEKEFLQKLYYALLCVPLSIASKITFGTGLYDEGSRYNADIAHCREASYTGVRKVGGEWKAYYEGEDRDAARKAYNEKAKDDEFGGKYIKHLKKVGVDKAEQLKDVLQAVPTLLIRRSAYKRFGMNPDTSGEEELVKEWVEVKGASREAPVEAAPESEEAKIERLGKPIADAWNKVRQENDMSVQGMEEEAMNNHANEMINKVLEELGDEYELIGSHIINANIRSGDYIFMITSPAYDAIWQKTGPYQSYELINSDDELYNLAANSKLVKPAYCKVEDFRNQPFKDDIYEKGLIDVNPEREVKGAQSEAAELAEEEAKYTKILMDAYEEVYAEIQAQIESDPDLQGVEGREKRNILESPNKHYQLNFTNLLYEKFPVEFPIHPGYYFGHLILPSGRMLVFYNPFSTRHIVEVSKYFEGTNGEDDFDINEPLDYKMLKPAIIDKIDWEDPKFARFKALGPTRDSHTIDSGLCHVISPGLVESRKKEDV
ncbi:hypothetical protein ACFL3C_05340 [Patescibacteria group bacterium]